MRNTGNDIAACLLPVVLVMVSFTLNIAAHAKLVIGPGAALASYGSIAILAILLAAGAPYYINRPLIGLLTSASLLAILAVWYDIVGAFDMLLVAVCGLVGAAAPCWREACPG